MGGEMHPLGEKPTKSFLRGGGLPNSRGADQAFLETEKKYISGGVSGGKMVRSNRKKSEI